MAEDDKTAETPKPGEPPEGEAKPSVDPHRPSGKSEWTASDGRGPLERASEEEEAARREAESHPVEAVGPSKSDFHAYAAPGVEDTTAAAEPSPAAGTPETGPVVPAPASESSGSRTLWPVAAAVVLGAIIGAGSAYIDGRYLQGGGDQGADVSSLAARVDALEKRPDAGSEIAGMKSNVTALANRVAALQAAAGSSEPAAEKPAPAPPPAAAAPDLGPLNKKLAALQADLDALKTKETGGKGLQDRIAAMEGALAGLKTATAAAQAGVSTVEGQQKSLAGRVMMPALAVVADSLVQQIELGQPYAAQVDALVALGVDPAKTAVLRQNAEQGVPSAKTLAAKFEPLAEPVASTAHKPPPNAGFVDRLKSGMSGLVSIRRADDTSGDDLPSRVARIKAALAHNDVPGAVSAWEALPPDAQAKSSSWGALAKASADAMNAARALQREAIVALGSKKS